MTTRDVNTTAATTVTRGREELEPRTPQAAQAPPRESPGDRDAPTGDPEGHGADEETPRARWIWRLLGPALGLAVFVLLPAHEQLSGQARAAAALATLMAIWWMSEAFPLPVTSLVPIVALPMFGILEVNDATSPYASPIVFLFMGGFVIALAMQRWGLHTRIALHTVRIVGTQPRRMVLGVMVATALLSMWVSNTAATLMMLPIGLSVLGMTSAERTSVGTGGGSTSRDDSVEPDPAARRFATCVVLAIAYSATIGGLSTLIGSPPTLVMAGFVEDAFGISIGFARWMALGVPLAAVMLVLAWLFLTRIAFPAPPPPLVEGRRELDRQLADLGRTSAGEWMVMAVFAATALLWVGHGPLTQIEAVTSAVPLLAHLSDEVIAIGAAIILLAVPVPGQGGEPILRWSAAQKGLPWGVLLLFGGGLSLARGVRETGLDAYLGSLLSGLGTLPLVLLIAATAITVLLLTELTSNTATAATFVPVLAGVAVAAGLDPMSLLIPAALAATCSFMLPVGTPPNAIVFASGHVTIGQMARTGLWLNVLAVFVITGGVLLLGGTVTGT